MNLRIHFFSNLIFVLFSCLGIPMYGIRETAYKKNDLKARSKLVIELVIILLITTVISYVILFFVLQISSLQTLKTLIIILSSMIFFTNLGVASFYQGIEDQKYITVRYFVYFCYVC